MSVRYVHTNIIARDWRALASFYIRLFDCKPVPPERDLAGDWLDAATGIAGSHITGVHLRLPGHGDTGPTLEIFSYDAMTDHPDIAANTPGFSHIAFLVDDVDAVSEAVLAAGGAAVGKTARRDVPGVGRLSFRYLRDPEGNILEVQRWD
ncbi:VOC family protein [Solidesulfovibrio sp.]|jgi:predicted enzyme related to lactoylglutathione lyase|uniref:VOC family protein n=1 Tax=Solidesulfovibrio sp. TaxID=2910990 RepID=UPI000ED09668|nr:VOC family protein [Solidesulfovibrio sp.]MEA5088769.1 VOC family protein [Solidesulfovibrio sp.]HCR13536.1 glyoxalase [Desulfovibrio sp.]HML61057.1 VOC family protein [Solidesulfovibrio sp.]